MAAVSAALPAVKALSKVAASSLLTQHLYYDDTELFSSVGRIVSQYAASKDSQEVLVLDQTVMHPQGGGQPSDVGVISSPNGQTSFRVGHVQKPRGAGYIEHIGEYSSPGRFTVGDEVSVEIDSARRMLHARLHSAGHLLDTAFVNIGVTDLLPEKGYHFPDGPYVEYVGNIPAEKREATIQQLNKEAQRLIEEAAAVVVTMNDKGERVVDVGGTACPCGGTHVKRVADITGLTVTKIKKSKKNVRVSYVLNDN